MDILDELHKLANIRQSVMHGLEFDAVDVDIARARKAFDNETEVLQEIAKYIHSEQAKGKCQNKSCPHYSLGQANGCTIYDFISICVDTKRGA